MSCVVSILSSSLGLRVLSVTLSLALERSSFFGYRRIKDKYLNSNNDSKLKINNVTHKTDSEKKY